MAYLIDSAGSVVQVPDDQVEAAVNMGYVPASPEQIATAEHAKATREKYGGTTGALKAGGLAAARALTLGISDLALTQTGAVTPEDARGYKAENPTADLVGTVGGLAGPFLLSGGAAAAPGALGATARVTAPAAIARAGTATQRAVAGALGASSSTAGPLQKILAKTAALGAGSGVEGAAYGAGQVVSEAALGDPGLTAESALATVGLSAALGGAVGLVGGGVWNASAGIMDDTVLKAKAASWLAKAERVQTMKATHASPGLLRKKLDRYSGDQIDAFIREGRDMKIVTPMMTPDRVVRATSESLTENGKALGSLLKELDLTGVQPPNMTSVLMKARRKFVAPLHDKGIPAYTAAAGRVNEVIDAGMKKFKLQGTTMEGIWQYRVDLDSQLNWAKANLRQDPTAGALHRLRSHVDDALASAMPAAKSADYKALKRKFEVASFWNELARAGTKMDAGYSAFSMTSMLGGVGASAAGGPVAGVATAIGSQYAKRHGNAVLGAAAGKARQLLDSGVADFIPDAVSAIARAEVSHGLADYAADYVKEAGRDGALVSLANETGKRISGERSALDMDPTRMSPQPVGDSSFPVENEPERVAMLAHLERTRAEVMRDIENRVKYFIGDYEPVAGRDEVSPGVSKDFARSQEDARKLFYKRVEAVQRAANDPDLLHRLLVEQTEDWFEHAPDTATMLNMVTARNISFLAKKVPQSLAPSGPLATPPQPSRDDIAKFNRYWDALDNPLGVLKQARAGNLSPQSIEAMKFAYPALMAEIQKSISGYIAKRRGKQLPYQKRIAISHIMGSDVDGSQNPTHLIANQRAYATMSQQQQSPKPQGGGKPSITLGTRSRTRTQGADDEDAA